MDCLLGPSEKIASHIEEHRNVMCNCFSILEMCYGNVTARRNPSISTVEH